MEPTWLEEARKAAARKPRSLLFLCVQNSARSQLAEALARHLAPAGVSVSSAGSQPATVRPQVLEVLSERGVSTSGLHSKSVDDLGDKVVDLVVTLCAEEVCPVFLKNVPHLHWALPDPARVQGEPARLDAFRQVRDELLVRLPVLFSVKGEDHV